MISLSFHLQFLYPPPSTKCVLHVCLPCVCCMLKAWQVCAGVPCITQHLRHKAVCAPSHAHACSYTLMHFSLSRHLETVMAFLINLSWVYPHTMAVETVSILVDKVTIRPTAGFQKQALLFTYGNNYKGTILVQESCQYLHLDKTCLKMAYLKSHY